MLRYSFRYARYVLTALSTVAFKLTGILATHPLTEDRIKAINPLPPGIAREVLPVEDWTKLRSICTPQ